MTADDQTTDGLRRDRLALAHAFPACFIAPGGSTYKRPLKVGIAAELLARGVPGIDDPARVKAALADYCDGPKYLKALVKRDAVRIGLDGEDAGPVAVSERLFAKHQMVRAGWWRGAAVAPEQAEAPASTP